MNSTLPKRLSKAKYGTPRGYSWAIRELSAIILIMTKSGLIRALEKQGNIPSSEAERLVNSCFRSMIEALYRDDRIEIRGFGSFANRNYKSYEGRNPKTSRVVKVAPKKAPFFKVGKDLKERVDAGRDNFVIQEA